VPLQSNHADAMQVAVELHWLTMEHGSKSSQDWPVCAVWAQTYRLPLLTQVSTVQVLPSLQSATCEATLHSHVHVPALHALAAHVSPVVQASPSSHGAVLAACTQPLVVLQLSSVQGLLSLQSTAAPMHAALPSQVSDFVQAFLSSHPIAGVTLFLQAHRPEPVWNTHTSEVQALLSLQAVD